MSSFRRQEALRALKSKTFDVLVIGGGMTGTGVALDAASRGLSVALIEAEDFASGTSSKSSKMVHGGLRYLQQREFRLVYENLHERQRLLKNAPHLVSPLPFLIPLFGKDGVVAKSVSRAYKSALWLYDLTGGVRIGKRHKQISKDQVLAHLPSLDVSRLVAGFLYYDARGDDARVALTLAQSAADHGAVCVNYAPATGLIRDARGRVTGATVTARNEDGGLGAPFAVPARVVVNAAGVFVDEVSSLDHHEVIESLTPAKGVHVTIPSHRLSVDIGAVIPVVEDKRSIFVVPWEEGGYVFLGTTDTAYEGPLHDPACEPEDVAYLLNAVNALTSANLTPDDVTGTWAGLRPLLKPTEKKKYSARTADLSRRHRVETTPDGMVLITGGKWTTYRKMAEDTVDEIARQIPGLAKCRTQSLALHGAPVKKATTGESSRQKYLFHRFGSFADQVDKLIADDERLGERIVPTLPYVMAEVVYAARFEMAQTLDDVLARRTRLRLIDARASLEAAPRVAAVLGNELGWSAARLSRELENYEALVSTDLSRAGLSRHP